MAPAKATFLDALRFLHDCMHAPVDQVLQSGSSARFRKLSGGKLAGVFSIHVQFRLEDDTAGSYMISVAASAGSISERCEVGESWFSNGTAGMESNVGSLPPQPRLKGRCS